MKTVLLIVFSYLFILTVSHGQLNEETTVSSCPARSATDHRGPPGIPGKPGSKGKRCML